MAADRDRVLKRVTEVLNLCAPGTYSATISPRNKTRNADAIEDFVDEAGLEILKAIAERPNEFRYQFLSVTSNITTSGDRVPNHVGPPESILITLGDGSVVEGARRDYKKIRDYRNLPQVYDPRGKAHNVAGSSLGGFYDIWDDKFYFTGVRASLELARKPVRGDTAQYIPDILEPTWVKLAIGNAEKVGTGSYASNVIASNFNKGMGDLQEFKTGSRVFKEVDVPEPAPSHALP